MKDKALIKKIIIASISVVLLLVTVALSLATYKLSVKLSLFGLVFIVIILFLLGILLKKERMYKIAIIIAIFGTVLIAAITAVMKSGVFEEINSTEELVALVNSFGVGGKLIFILIQFLQVTFIPIPSTIVTATGAALYSTGEAMLLSCIGLWLGSLFAFFLGRTFGVKLVKWVIGDEMLLKYNGFVKGKDKAMLIYMFVFPIFPDDMLCMLAGLTTMSYPGFILIQLIARPLNVACTVFAIDYLSAVPFSGWGIVVWALIAIFFIAVFVLMWKYSEKLENGLLKFISKVTGRPIVKDINAVYNIYNIEHKKEKGIGYTEPTRTQSSQEHKERADNIATTKEVAHFESTYNTINGILNKDDKPIEF